MDRNSALQQVDREGRERLYPSITNPSWLVLRERREIFRQWMSLLPARGLNVLDVGGRLQPYRALLGEQAKCYISLDLRLTPRVDVLASGEQLPLRENVFDLVICTQVLEYVSECRLMVEEIHRVLKPGGKLFLSVPLMFPTDSDQDLWRFTPGGLRVLLAHFRKVEIRPEGNSIYGLFRTVALWVSFFARPMPLANLVRYSLIPFLNITAAGLAWIIPVRNDQFAANYSVCAEK